MSEITANIADSGDRTGTVLVVDDEPTVVELYAKMLSGAYDVATATGGEEALEVINDDVDVILLDRRMPDLAGGEVLNRLREDGHECMVAMITAIRPEHDILSMDIDAYRVKPIGAADLNDLVDELLLRSEYSDSARELLAASEKLGTLRSEYSSQQLRSMDEFLELEHQYREMLEESENRFEELAERVNPATVYRDLLET